MPPDIKEGFARLDAKRNGRHRQSYSGTMIRNIRRRTTNNLLCQDTGIPIYNVAQRHRESTASSNRRCNGLQARRRNPLRSSVVHPMTRKNEHTSCGRLVPVINFDFTDRPEVLSIEMIPKGSGSENNSWLKMAIPADGIDAIKTFVVDCILEAGGKTCPPTIVGVGVGGTADLCVHLSKVAATRALGSKCDDPEGAALEAELSAVVNQLGVGAQGLGGDSTSFAVHVETAATHITMNPVAVNMQCHSARRARATFTPNGITYGF
jgi:fumarate hydratase subunit alpha/L(+)-tartrate dehydratase alpha subunit